MPPFEANDRLPPAKGLLIFLIPVVIGVIFWSDSSGHGDSAIYRQFIEWTWESGTIPNAPMVWHHPGLHAVAAPLYGLGRWLGIWEDPQGICTLLAFLALGLAGWTVARMFRLWIPRSTDSLAVFAGLSCVTVPGWLWHSQERMSDVLGHALVLTWTARWLLIEGRARRESEGEPLQSGLRCSLSWALTGFLATYAILVRVSSASFGLLYLYLWLRACFATGNPRDRITRSLAMLIGGALPVAAIYGHLVHAHGWTGFWTKYLEFGHEKWEMRVGWAEMQAAWLSRTETGTGPVLLVLGITGAFLYLLQNLRRGSRRIFHSRNPVFWSCILLTLPYYVAVAFNRGWAEFRYQLPTMMMMALGTTAVAILAERRLGSKAPPVLALVLVAGNLVYAGPWLWTFATRTHFTEAGTRETVGVATPGSVLLGGQSGKFLLYQARGEFMVVAVAGGPSRPGEALWSTAWSTAIELLANAHANGRPIYFYNEPDLAPFLERLRRDGWRSELKIHRSFAGLRNARDRALNLMDLDLALEERPLDVQRLIAPDDLPHPVRATISRSATEPASVLVQIDAPGKAGWRYRILAAKETRARGTLLPGQLFVHFDAADPLIQPCIQATAMGPAPFVGFVGTLDAQGAASVTIGTEAMSVLQGAWFTALVYPEGWNWSQARLRSPTRRLP